VKGN
jgi:uncharacterized Fe-S cluster protein YjdI